MTALDDLRHLAEEERQEQRADVGAVNVRIRHDNDLVVAQLLDVEVLGADTGAKRGDERADLIGREHAVEACALDVQDLATQRQDRLILARAAGFGRATGGVALHDEDLALGGIALLAVRELAGQ